LFVDNPAGGAGTRPLFLYSAMGFDQLETLLRHLGCPPEKCADMAAQLDKRAQQLAAQKGRPYEEALTHLLTLMRQGWAAKERGFQTL
jgi:hypothetical protein